MAVGGNVPITIQIYGEITYFKVIKSAVDQKAWHGDCLDCWHCSKNFSLP